MKLKALLFTLIHAIGLWSSTSFAGSMPLIPRGTSDDDSGSNSAKVSSLQNTSSSTVDSTNGHDKDTSPDDSTPGGLGSIKPRTDLPSLMCEGDFFAATKANWDASGAGPAYVVWIQGADKNSDEWIHRHSEEDYFAKKILDWPENIECSPDQKGCNPMPNCDRILSRVRDREQARQIFLLFTSFNLANLRAGVTREQSLAAQVGVASKAMDLAHTFFWLHDNNIDRKCAIIAGFVKGVISAVLSIAVAAAPALIAVEGAAVGIAAGASAGTVAGVSAESAAQAASRIPWNNIAAAGMRAGKSAAQGAPGTFLTSIPTFVMSDVLENSICKHKANAPKDAEAINEKMLNGIIERAGSEYRAGMDQTMYEINHGTGYGDNGTFEDNGWSLLANMVFDGNFVELTRHEREMFIDYPSKLEANMKQHFTNAMISQSLKNGMCYLHCTNLVPKASEVNMADSRFEPVPGTYCQPQCWQNFEVKKSTALEMFGINELSKPNNRFGIMADEFVNAAYKRWQQNHYSQENFFPTIDEAINGTKAMSSSGSFMPVCYNDAHLHDISDKHSKQVKYLPCICGDQFGNETTEFLSEAGINQWVDAEGGKGIAEACQRSFNLDATRTVPSYLAICGLDWHFPVRGDKKLGIPRDRHHRFGKGHDYYCDAVHEQATGLAAKGMAAKDLDCEICNSDTGMAIRHLQRSFVHHNGGDSFWNLNNFNRSCTDECWPNIRDKNV